MMQNIFLFFSTFGAYFVKGITGFGNTLVMGTLFSFVIGNRLTTPVDLLLSIPTNSFIVWRERKNISWKVVVPLSLMLLIGIIPGTFLLKIGNDWVLKSILGIVVLGIAIEMLTRRPGATGQKPNPVALICIGVLSGVLAGMYGISALLVAYISRTTDTRNQFRANLCCVFLADNVFRFMLYWCTGLLTREVLLVSLALAPAVAVGMYLGVKVDAKMNDKAVRYATIVLLMVSGLSLFIKSVFFH